MNAYSLLIVGILLASLVTDHSPGRGNWTERKKSQKRHQFIVIACLLLYAVYGLRDAFAVGGDSTSSYLHRFQDIDTLSFGWFSGENWAFFFLMKGINFLTDGDYQFFISFISAFVMIVFARFLWKYSPNPLLSVFCYLGLLQYIFMFSALKQSIAMAFVLLAFDGIMEQKWFKFVILVLIGSCFHVPALVFLPAYWIVKRGIGKNYLLTATGMLVLTFVFRSQLLNIMLSIYGTEVQTEEVGFFGTKVIVMILMVALALFLRPPTEEDRLYNTLLAFMGLAIVFQTFCFYNNTFERLADYYFQFAVIFIPLMFDRTKRTATPLPPLTEHHIKRWVPYGIEIFAIWRFLEYISNNKETFLPYRFFFSK